MFIHKKSYFIFTILFAVLVVLDLGLYTVFEFTGFLSEIPHFVSYLIVISLFVFVALFFTYLLKYFNAKISLDILHNQNMHAFGKRSEYFDRTVFENVVNILRRKRKFKKRNQTLILFTGVPQSLSLNTSRRQNVIDFQSRTIEFLYNYFVQEKSESRHVYCYDEGSFMIYCFGDSRMDIIHLVSVINDKLYQIVQQSQIHLLVTPYFGIDEVNEKESLLEAIENASLSRKISEKNFEMFNFYQSSFRQSASKDDAQRILDALKNKEFVVYYQPKFDLLRNCFISSEALIRWNSPTMGLLMPQAFVSVASAAGLTHELDLYVFEMVCENLMEAKKKGRRLLPVSMNFSLYEFYSADFLSLLISTMKKYSVDPRLIQIEILETTSQANPFLSVSIIKKLKDIGIRVLMDDFGIGYSNLGNLSKIPFDTIKIDKSYIDNIVEDKKARQIVQCMVDLGKINGLEVVAEGVDNAKQVEILSKMGCDTIQGFYYSKPLNRDEFERFLLDNPFEKEERR